MLYVQTVVNIVDNSGGLLGLCIRVLGSAKRVASAGDAIIVTVKSILINRKVVFKRKKKIICGAVKKVIVLRTSYRRRRHPNFFFKNATNAVAVLGNWGMPLGSRAKGPGHYELRGSKFAKFATICEGVI